MEIVIAFSILRMKHVNDYYYQQLKDVQFALKRDSYFVVAWYTYAI